MIQWLAWGCVAVYFAAAIFVIAYGLQMHILTWRFARRWRAHTQLQRSRIEWYATERPERAWPLVTTQIPLYNEANVAQRVIEAVARMDYPADRHEVQVLDDSTDETRDIVDATVTRLRALGHDVRAIRRDDRRGYKAGALAAGLREASGQLIAIFDADFVPPADFLRRSVPLLMDEPTNACVQARWSHLNQEASWLTRAQSLAIDGHFAVEQGGRCFSGLFMNFNGTAGVWRRTAITDPAVGGWTADTLTEDLDLSYRAQLAGWTMEYAMFQPCPSELPATIPALKLQQHRWAKGTMQCARKLLPRIWRSPFGLGVKLAATGHLTGYLISVAMLVVGLLSLPIAMINPWRFLGWGATLFIGLIYVSLLGPIVAHAYSRRVLTGRWRTVRASPALMLVGMGMCLSTGLACLSGLIRRGGEFRRTPKSGVAGATRTRYVLKSSPIWLAELAAAAYSCATLYYAGFERAGLHGVFLAMFAAGFAIVGWMSSPFAETSRRSRKFDTRTATRGVPSVAPTIEP
ncbi:MAG TPA: glycosyltransferase [Phycisphaerae bacterium]|nr:glycosyltransferase [Phycisphaerae bacterium]HRW52607.1 glycosyltransferase [Phycisphaerae bacterium]